LRSGSVFLAAAFLAVFALPCRPQVLAPAEILDPAMKELQQKHLAELKAAAVDITTHNYPYKFYLSRTLDVTARQEQLTDQRSIRFAKFQDKTVLQVTGNYFAAYSDTTMNQSERVKRTYLDVMLPILRAAVARLEQEPQMDAFAIEVSHHVRKRVLGVTVETQENVAVIVPRSAAESAVSGNDTGDEIRALKQARVYVDSRPVSLWPESAPEKAAVASLSPATPPPAPPAAATPSPARDVSSEALRKQQESYQEPLDRMVHELDAQAHFVAYAPPTLIAFHNQSYLQLSVTTTLSPSDTGSQYRIAALAFDRHISHLIRPVLAYFQQDPEFDGIVFSSTAHIPGETADLALAQSVEFFFPLAELRRYERYDITGQQLINSGFVLINGERVSLELQAAESNSR
jgi:hypothetical protein